MWNLNLIYFLAVTSAQAFGNEGSETTTATITLTSTGPPCPTTRSGGVILTSTSTVQSGVLTTTIGNVVSPSPLRSTRPPSQSPQSSSSFSSSPTASSHPKSTSATEALGVSSTGSEISAYLSSVLSQEHNPTTVATSSSPSTSSSSSSSTSSLGAAPAANAANHMEMLSWLARGCLGLIALVAGASLH